MDNLYFSDTNLTFFYLHSLLFLTLFVFGIILSKQKRVSNYYLSSILPILVFSFVEGLRFGRGTDYNTYYYIYNQTVEGYEFLATEPVWNGFIYFFGYYLGVPWQGFVLFMSFMLILSGIIFLKNHRSILFLALPLFAFYTIQAENLMRWYLAFSFILIGLHFYEIKNYYKLTFFFIFAFLIHYGIIIIMFVYIVLMFLKRPLLKPVFSLTLFVLIFLFSNPERMSIFADLFNTLELGSRYIIYKDNIEDWLTGANYEGTIQKISVSNFFVGILVVVIGYKIVNKRPNLALYYNLSVLGFVLAPFFNIIELLNRVNQLLVIFQVIILSYVVLDTIKLQRALLQKCLVTFVLLFILRTMIIYPLDKEPNRTLFIWNANGRHTL